MKNRKGFVEVFIAVAAVAWIMMLVICLSEIQNKQNEISLLKTKSIKYGYARIVVENDQIVFKFNAEIEGEVK